MKTLPHLQPPPLSLEICRDLWASLHSRKLVVAERPQPFGIGTRIVPISDFTPDEEQLYAQLTRMFLTLSGPAHETGYARAIAADIVSQMDAKCQRTNPDAMSEPRPTWEEMTGFVLQALRVGGIAAANMQGGAR